MRLHIPEHHNLEADKNQLLEIINQHQLKLQRSLELKEHYLVYQEQLHAIMQDLQKEQQQILQQESLAVEKLILEKQIHKQQLEQLKQTEHEQKQKQKTIEHELTSCYTQLQKINVNLSKQAPITQQFEKRKEYYQKFIAQGTLVQQELINLQHKQQLAHDDANPSCPLCEQNLSASRRRFLKQKFIKEEQFLKHRYNQFATIVKKLKTLLLEQHKEVEAFTVKANNRQLLLIKQGELGKRNNELQTALQSLQEKQQAEHKTVAHLTESISHASQQLEENEKRSSQFLEENPHYQITKKELHNIEKQLNGINYQPAQHNNMQNQLKEIEKKLVAYQKNLEQITLQDQRKQSIQELCSTLKKMKKEKSVLATKLEAFSSLSSRKEILNEQKQELVSNTHMLGKQKEILLQEKGRLKQQCNKHIQLEHEYKQLQKTVISLVESTEDYQAIAMATSKDGIQALLIQDIIPEIEQEANALLSKLTDNQTQIFIESLRDLKKGGTKETLDIKISDTIGIRPYELFSGGEAFRIDFALRVAISKLLARRAGTSLQTLIIDEGFGSQDEEGLAHIMDAIYKIQDDFAKVIIVSHLSTMKDLFPINFLIEKGINGSTITVLEQG